jgi:hypothetical protein
VSFVPRMLLLKPLSLPFALSSAGHTWLTTKNAKSGGAVHSTTSLQLASSGQHFPCVPATHGLLSLSPLVINLMRGDGRGNFIHSQLPMTITRPKSSSCLLCLRAFFSLQRLLGTMFWTHKDIALYISTICFPCLYDLLFSVRSRLFFWARP